MSDQSGQRHPVSQSPSEAEDPAARQRMQSEPTPRSNRWIGRRFRYADDYRLVPDLGSRGDRLHYIGPWIRPANGPEDYKKRVRWMQGLTLAAVIATLAALAIHPAEQTLKFYLPVLVFCLFPLAYQCMGAVRMPSQVKHMERQHYDKSILRTGHSAAFALVVMVLSALLCVLYWILAACGNLEGEAPYALADGLFATLLLLAAGLELAVWRIFRKIHADTLDNDAYQR